ncbi:DUF58 domain-containing protein [Ahrensia marina]|uniref:DUF58 domain-containing protein n=1 Tax=Ahrensia marina TaxID=1514904 RepID=UPI0035D08ADF
MINWLGRNTTSQGPGGLAPLDPLDLGTRPRALADAMPDLMVEAKNLAASLLAGLHGRKRAGSGQSFWQFRQYGSGDASSRIDWRRSARGDALFVREMEWESAHTVRLSVDMSSSMRFASPDAREPKRDRAVVMALALAAMLTKGGERVGLIGGERPKTGHAALNTMALELITRDTDKSGKLRWSDMTAVKPREDVIILSDFLFDEESRSGLVEQLVARGARAHLVQIVDPVEEAFPFKGRMRFQPLSKNSNDITAGRAESWQQPYQVLFRAFTDELRQIARARGWSHTVSHTDRPAATPLLNVHEALSRARDR